MGRPRAGRLALAPALGGLLAVVGSAAVGQSGSAPQVSVAGGEPSAADFVVLSRTDNTQSVEASDLRLVLTKARLEEHALVRRLIFITATLRLTEPSAQVGEAPPVQTCRWSYRSAMQRQICFTSMAGLLGCTQPEITTLPDQAQGDAPAPAGAQPGFCNDAFRPAVNARVRLTSALIARSKDLFAEDQRAKVDLMFKAAGVTARPELPGPPPTSPSAK